MALRYRIRVGRKTFLEPHYVSKLTNRTETGEYEGYEIRPLTVNRNPCSWVKYDTAAKYLPNILKHNSTAEIEAYSTEEGGCYD